MAVRGASLTVVLLPHLVLMVLLHQEPTMLPIITSMMVTRTERKATTRTTMARALPAQALTAKADAHAVVDVTDAVEAAVASLDVEVSDPATVALAVTVLVATMVHLTMKLVVMALEASITVPLALLLMMAPKDLTKGPMVMAHAVTAAHAITADLDDTVPGASTAPSADHATVAVSADHTQLPNGAQVSVPRT